jgi:hypothetical protein
MKWWAVVLIALGTFVLGLGIGGAVGGTVGYAAGFAKAAVDRTENSALPESPVTVTVTAPASVKVGEEFDLIVTASNPGQSLEVLGDLDVDLSYLALFDVVSTQPPMSSEDQMDSWRTFDTGQSVQPGQTTTLTIRLRAKQAGTASGLVSLYPDSSIVPLGMNVETIVQ